MNVLLIGSGGREHAIAWKLSQSDLLDQLYIAPGNPGTAQCGNNVPIGVNDFEKMATFVAQNKIDMVIVGPEDPLVNGISDYFKSHPQLSQVPVIGPSKVGAQLEGSKDFAKQFMQRQGIPTAQYRSFTLQTIESAKAFLKELKPPYVLKADGLAAGKGVVILSDYEQACNELFEMLSGKFGSAGNTVVIEEFLSGIEMSVFVLTDGISYKILPSAKDYKRIGDGDTGLNTGGMGAVSPVSFADAAFMKKVEERIIKPTVNGLASENIDYKGFIFFGLINCDGEPFVIEYNTRMGDPETEVVMPRLQSDLLEHLVALAEGKLADEEVVIDSRYAVTVMMVSGGYPGEYKKGFEITGLNSISHSIAFQAGTTDKNGKIVTSGGRVISVTSYGQTLDQALNKSYNSVEKISFDGAYFRRDIGQDL